MRKVCKNTFKNENVSQINTLKIISAFAVFIIHYFGIYMNEFGINDANLALVRMICNFSVPSFFMISGFLHSDKDYSYTKILYKVLYYYLITVFINIIYSILYQIFKLHNNNIDIPYIIIDSIKLNLTSHSHLWFMLCIMVIYLFIPVFSSLTDNKLFVFTIICTILSFIKPLYFSIFNFPFPLQYFFSYYLIGASYKRMHFEQKSHILVLSILLFIITIIAYGENSIGSYNSIGTFFLTNIIFLIIIQYSPKCAFFDNISNTSFLLYLTHPFPIHLLFTILKYKPNNFTQLLLILILLLSINILMIKSFYFIKSFVFKTKTH